MKILILDNYYRGFLSAFYSKYPEIHLQNFESHRHSLMLYRFGTSDTYSNSLIPLGHEAQEIVTNDDYLQLKWGREHGVFSWKLPYRLNQLTNRFLGIDVRYRILTEQIKAIRPDILFVQEQNILLDKYLLDIKPYCGYLVAQVGSQPPKHRSYRHYDLVLTSFPHFVERFNQQGIRTRYFRLGFDNRVLNELSPDVSDSYEFTFVGAFFKVHKNRYQILNELSKVTAIDIFGYSSALPNNSAIAARHRGEAWGLDMYRVLAKSRLTLNNHEKVAGRFANNMRLYEATGVGTCLLTDAKENLAELFEPDVEVVTYSNLSELVEKARYLLDHEDVRAAVAQAGQKRTLKDHTWKKRMEELTSIFSEELR
jgi:spore maturation protein CgeB